MIYRQELDKRVTRFDLHLARYQFRTHQSRIVTRLCSIRNGTNVQQHLIYKWKYDAKPNRVDDADQVEQRELLSREGRPSRLEQRLALRHGGGKPVSWLLPESA